MLGLNNSSFHRGEEIIDTFRPRFLVHSKVIFLKLIGVIILIYSFGFLVNIMYKIQSAAINIVHLPLVQYSIYFIILIVFVVILWVIFDLLKWYSKKYVLTNQRIISQSGLFRKKKSSIIYDKIEDITIFQNLSSRLVSAGTIHIYGGHDGLHVVLEDVPNPDYVEEEINKLMSDSWKRSKYHNSKMNKHHPKRRNSYNYGDYNELTDFDYIDRTTPSKPYVVNTFDNDYDERYGYGDKSNYYGEESDYDNYSIHNNVDYQNDSYNINGSQSKHNNDKYYGSELNSKSEKSFNNKSKKLGFDDPEFWEDDYPKEQSLKSNSKKYKSRDSFKKNRKNAMDKHSERFKIN